MRVINLLTIACLGNWKAFAFSTTPQQPLHPSSPSKADLVDLHQSLIEHPSITGAEHSVVRFLVSYLRRQNFTVETQLVSRATVTNPARHNILAYAGKSRKTKTLVTSHIDAVPPFRPYERYRDEIWGRGSVVAQIKAVMASGSISEGDVALLFVVGEETGGGGMCAANHLGLSWETVVFGEPTELKLASGHKGVLALKITAKGKAGHSEYPELGRNANVMLVKVLCALEGLELPWRWRGKAADVIVEDAEAELAIRIAAGGPRDVKKLIFEAVKKMDESIDVEFSHGYGPIDIDHDVDGFETIVVNYGTDIPNLMGNHKMYLYGPGDILVAHLDHEHLKISDLERAVEGYKTLVRASLEE